MYYVRGYAIASATTVTAEAKDRRRRFWLRAGGRPESFDGKGSCIWQWALDWARGRRRGRPRARLDLAASQGRKAG